MSTFSLPQASGVGRLQRRQCLRFSKSLELPLLPVCPFFSSTLTYVLTFISDQQQQARAKAHEKKLTAAQERLAKASQQLTSAEKTRQKAARQQAQSKQALDKLQTTQVSSNHPTLSSTQGWDQSQKPVQQQARLELQRLYTIPVVSTKAITQDLKTQITDVVMRTGSDWMQDSKHLSEFLETLMDTVDEYAVQGKLSLYLFLFSCTQLFFVRT